METERTCGTAGTSASRGVGWDLALWAGVLLCANLALATGGATPVARYAFLPGRVAAGEWWRLATHPLAHVSAYHLLLDAGAFLVLYHGLAAFPLLRRLALCAGAAVCSLALAACAPEFDRAGLCGLSGVAHGLMAVSALGSARSDDPCERAAGRWLLALVAGKAALEAATGHVWFAAWHLGDVGLPNPYGHLGGVLGGLFALRATGRRR